MVVIDKKLIYFNNRKVKGVIVTPVISLVLVISMLSKMTLPFEG